MRRRSHGLFFLFSKIVSHLAITPRLCPSNFASHKQLLIIPLVDRQHASEERLRAAKSRFTPQNSCRGMCDQHLWFTTGREACRVRQEECIGNEALQTRRGGGCTEEASRVFVLENHNELSWRRMLTFLFQQSVPSSHVTGVGQRLLQMRSLLIRQTRKLLQNTQTNRVYSLSRQKACLSLPARNPCLR